MTGVFWLDLYATISSVPLSPLPQPLILALPRAALHVITMTTAPVQKYLKAGVTGVRALTHLTTSHVCSIWFLRCLWLVPLLAFPVDANAQGDFGYADNGDGTVTITNYTGASGSVNIPITLDGHPVTRLGSSAFSTGSQFPNLGLTNVHLPEGLLDIGSGAFAYTGLTSLTIPNSVTNIGANAFLVVSLANVEGGNGVTVIGNNAFLHCKSLTNFSTGPSVGTIGMRAFGDTGLSSVRIPDSTTFIGATFSPELVDFSIYIIDVAQGEKIPRKAGQGMIKSDLFIINKTDLAPHVGADLSVMERDSHEFRGEKPFCFTNLKTDEGLDRVIEWVRRDVLMLDLAP